ncbi:MAG: O-antigen ligase family protein [Actinobacteria bacterium]|nr:O-antigen ligase family protein [Actinomycetota bacterium]
MDVKAQPARGRLATLAVVLGAGAAVTYVAFRSGSTLLGVLSLVTVALALSLALYVRPGTAESAAVEQFSAAVLLALPGAMVVYFAFSAGGFFPDAHAVMALVLLVVLVLRTTLVNDPFAGFGPRLAIAAGALALLTLWTLGSGLWSDAPARALIEANRSLVYLLALVLVGSLARTPERLHWSLRLTTAAIVGVVVAALVTRVLPDVFPTDPGLLNDRLSYPLTYWNTLGMLGSLAAIFCLHATTSLRQPAPVRVAGAAALPAVAATVLFTFSRGAILAGGFALVLYVLLARPRGLLTGLAAAAPPTVLAVMSAYGAELLATESPATAAATEQGHEVALVIALCCVAAGVLRLVLVSLDVRLRGFRLNPERRQVVIGTAWAVGVALVVSVVLALGIPGRAADQYEAFVDSRPLPASADLRDRLGYASSNGRIEQWEVGLRLFEHARLRGIGAGTFGLLWTEQRPATIVGLVVDDAHSLYVETLAELGLIGFALLLVALGSILAATVPIRRGPQRSLYAALFTGTLAWAVHAGVDWDWEMPALSAWVFGLGGLALAAPVQREPGEQHAPPGRTLRLAVGLAATLAALGPGLLLVSERRLDEGVAAFERGDCGRAIAAAASAQTILDVRPEPYEILGFCQTRRGFHRLAVQALERAVERDPANWEFRYGLALVRAAAGLDPRADARASLRLNPYDPRTLELDAILRERNDWQRLLALRARNERLSVVR